MPQYIYYISHTISVMLMSASMMWLIINKNKLTNLFIRSQILVIMWLVGQLLEVTSNDVFEQSAALVIVYIGVCFIGPSFFIFSYQFANHKKRLSKRYQALLYLPSFLLFILFLSNPFHHLFYTSYGYGEIIDGYGFYLNVIITYIFIFFSLSLIIIKSIKVYHNQRFQMWLIIFAVFIPTVLNILSLLMLPIDLTPFGFSISSVLILIAINKFEFININSIAINKIAEHMDDIIIVTDYNNNVTYVNCSFYRIFNLDQRRGDILNTDIINLLEPHISVSNAAFWDINGCKDSCKFHLKSGRIYLGSKYLIEEKGIRIGCIFKFIDLTDFYRISEEIEENNRKLVYTNEQLKQLSYISDQLATEKERMRIAQQLHDTIGHDLVNIMTLLKIETIESKSQNIGLNKALSITSGLLQNIRRYVSDLSDNEHIGLVKRLKIFVGDMELAHVSVELTISGKEKERHVFAETAIFNVVREAITNSVRHGHAQKVDIILKLLDREIRLFVFDDGVGCEKIHNHMGLEGMVKLIRGIGGRIVFQTEINEGFRINIIIPIQEETI